MKNSPNRDLTKAEEEVMMLLWRLKKAFVKDLLAEMSQPKPAYNTVSTIIRILEEKGFVAHESFGKSHQYYPLFTKSEYTRYKLTRLAKQYFGGSYVELVSFMADDDKLSVRDIEEIKKNLKK